MAVASVTAFSVLGGNVRSAFQPCHANRVLLAADAPAAEVLIAAKTGYTIHITHISASVTTVAAQAVVFADDASTPIKVATLPASAVLGPNVWSFGEEGVPLTESKNFTLTATAGVAAYIHVEGYYRQTSTLTPAQVAAA